MRLCTWILRIAAMLAMLLGVASAQTSDYKLQLVTGTGSSDTGTPSLSIITGQTGSAVVNIIPLNGFSDKVSFSCVGVPANGSCTFNPTAVTPDGVDPTLTTVTINTVANATALNVAPVYRRWLLGSFVAIAGTFFLIPAGVRRRRFFPLLMVLTLLMLMMGTACGGGSSTPSNQVQPGTYNIQVSSTSGSLIHSATLQLIITSK